MKNKSMIKISLFAAMIIAIFFLNKYYGWSKYLSNTENLSFIKNMLSENIFLAFCIYIVITIIGCVILAIPGVTFAVFAGILFGPWLGIFPLLFILYFIFLFYWIRVCCIFGTTIHTFTNHFMHRLFLK